MRALAAALVALLFALPAFATIGVGHFYRDDSRQVLRYSGSGAAVVAADQCFVTNRGALNSCAGATLDTTRDFMAPAGTVIHTIRCMRSATTGWDAGETVTYEVVSTNGAAQTETGIEVTLTTAQGALAPQSSSVAPVTLAAAAGLRLKMTAHTDGDADLVAAGYCDVIVSDPAL